jgi:hypothetical protein
LNSNFKKSNTETCHKCSVMMNNGKSSYTILMVL